MRTLSLMFTAGLLFGQASIAWTSPPSGNSPAAAAGGRSSVQRALDSRASLLQRANVSARGPAAAGASGNLPSGVATNAIDHTAAPAAGHSQAGQTTAAGHSQVGQTTAAGHSQVGQTTAAGHSQAGHSQTGQTTAAAHVHANANANANAAAAFSASAADAVQVGGHAQAEGQAAFSGSAAHPQSGTGRLPQEVARRRAGEFRARQSFATRDNATVQLGTAQGRERSGRPDGPPRDSRFGERDHATAPPAAAAAARAEAAGRTDARGRADVVAHGQNRLALTHADRMLAQRLAQIDAMRDRAVDAGNERLLEQADHLEQLARWQHAGRLAGRLGRAEYEVQADGEGEGSTVIRHPFRGMRDRAATTPPEDVENQSVE
jgi:hypothetical protein